MVSLWAASMPSTSRVGSALGVSERLRLREHLVERPAGPGLHLGEDEVSGAVDDSRERPDPVAGQPLADALDHRNGAGHRRLEGDDRARRAGRAEDLVAVQGDEGLVRGDHVLALPDGAQHEVARRAGAPDELDDHVDGGVVHHRPGVAGEIDPAHVALARAAGIAHGGPRHLDAPPGAARDLVRVAAKHVDGAAPDRAEPEHPDAYRFQWRSFFLPAGNGHELSSRCGAGYSPRGAMSARTCTGPRADPGLFLPQGAAVAAIVFGP